MALENIGAVSDKFLGIGLMIIVSIIIIAAIVGSLILYLGYRRYQQFNCIIFEKDGFGQLSRNTDQAGIYVDKKTNNKRLYLRKSNVGLDPDQIPYVIGPGSRKTIYLYKDGLKNFHYLKFKIDDKKFEIDVGEEDVNWAINAYERQKKMFSNSLLMQLMPYIAIAVVSIAILIIFIYFFKDFDVLREMAVALKEASIAFAQAQSGTTVISGTP